MDDKISTNVLSKDIQRKMHRAFELKRRFDELDAIIRDELKTAMLVYNVKSIKTDDFNVTLATRATYKATGAIPTGFEKTVLDTARVGTYDKLNGNVPDGIVKTEIAYIAYKNKAVK